MDRKEFLALSSLGFLGLSSCSILNYNSKNSISLAIQLYTIRDAMSENPEKALERLAAMGFTGLEIYGYNGTFFGKSRNEFRQILRNTGQCVISSHHTTGMLHREPGTLLQNWEKTVEDLKFIGAEFMVCSYLFPEERTAENYRRLPGILNAAGTVTRQSGIQFAYHNHDFEFEDFDGTGKVYDFILNRTSPELVQMELDLYWIAKAGFDPLFYFEKHPGRFPLWHVKDMKAGNGDFTEIGNGTIDFAGIFAAREKAGLRHWFLEQDSGDKDIFESISISRKYIQSHRKIFSS